MRMGMGLIRNRLGVYVVRRKVPAPLQEAVARVLNNGKTRQPWLQRTTGTKDKSEAKRIAVDIFASFDLTISEAQGLLGDCPLLAALSHAEIDRISEFWYAERLSGDEELALDGGAEDDEFTRVVADQLEEVGVSYGMPVRLDAHRAQYGLSDRMGCQAEQRRGVPAADHARGPLPWRRRQGERNNRGTAGPPRHQPGPRQLVVPQGGLGCSEG